MEELTLGTEMTITVAVEEKDTAIQIGSGSLRVLATPRVAALMEQAACALLAPFLEEGVTTVGTHIAVSHISATPVGGTVRVTAVLTQAEGRKYAFSVTAYDNAGLIAEGTHERFAVNTERFMQKTDAKLNG